MVIASLFQPCRREATSSRSSINGMRAHCSNPSPIGREVQGLRVGPRTDVGRANPIRSPPSAASEAATLNRRAETKSAPFRTPGAFPRCAGKGKPKSIKRRNPSPAKRGKVAAAGRGQPRAVTCQPSEIPFPTTPSPTKTVQSRTPVPRARSGPGLARQRPFLYHPTSFVPRLHTGQISHESNNN
jgi:hypothetical protein